MKVLLGTVLLLAAGLSCPAQKKPPYTIAAYEWIHRENGIDKNVYEIQSLFAKKGPVWEVADYSAKMDFNLVYKGKRGVKISGVRVNDTSFFRPEGNDYYKTTSRIALSSNYYSAPFKSADAGIKRMTFLTNYAGTKQLRTLKKYSPSKNITDKILREVKPYILSLYKNCESSMLTDSIMTLIGEAESIQIDPNNSFADENNNRLITIIYPVPFAYKSVYPFSPQCFREDNGYPGFRIMCYLDKNDKLSFLRDELNYIDHGDFDGDGKDEFLFWYGIYNHEGYVLYYDDFKKSVTKLWSYN